MDDGASAKDDTKGVGARRVFFVSGWFCVFFRMIEVRLNWVERRGADGLMRVHRRCMRGWRIARRLLQRGVKYLVWLLVYRKGTSPSLRDVNDVDEYGPGAGKS